MTADSLCFIVIGLSWLWKNQRKNTNFETSQAKPPKRRSDFLFQNRFTSGTLV